MSPAKLGHKREEAGKGCCAGREGQGTFRCSEHGDIAQGLPTRSASLPSATCMC